MGPIQYIQFPFSLSLSLFLSHPPSSLRFSLFFLPLRAPPFEIHCPDRKRAWDSKGSLSAHFFENYLRLRSFCEMNIWCGGPERLPRRAQSNTSENDWAEVYSSQLQNTHTHTHTHTTSSHPTHHHTPKKHSRRFMAGCRIRSSAS